MTVSLASIKAETTDAAATLAARLPFLETARTLYGRPDAEGELTYQIVAALVDALRRVEALERLNAEREGDGR